MATFRKQMIGIMSSVPATGTSSTGPWCVSTAKPCMAAGMLPCDLQEDSMVCLFDTAPR